MNDGDPALDPLVELGMLFAAGERAYGRDRALVALEEQLAAQPPEENVKLLAAAIATGPGRRESLTETRLKDQLYVLSLRAMLEVGEHRIGTNAAIDAMVTELAKKDAGELARALTLAVHLIIHP